MNDTTISEEDVARVNAKWLREIEALRRGAPQETKGRERPTGTAVSAESIGPIEIAERAGLIDRFDLCGGPESWLRRAAPLMTEGISEKPGGGASGEIQTAALQPGGVAYGGKLVYGQTDNEKFWIHNWHCLVTFPAAPARSELQYRLGVTAIANLRQAQVSSGGVWAFVTIGTTADANTPITNWTGVGFPVLATLPPASTPYFTGEAPVSGRFSVGEGRTPAVGLILGAVVSVRGGEVDYLWGTFGVHRPVAAGVAPPFEAYGRVEYRFCAVPVLDPG